MSNKILAMDVISKSYRQGNELLQILKEVSLDILEGQMVALIGPSGCGKSTLLHIAGLLDVATAGKVAIDGIDCATISDDQRTKIRNQKIGFVYQSHHLLPDFTAMENVMMPQIIAGVSTDNARKRSIELLNQLGLSARLDHLPSQLSGGEQQRVAIARALANKPKLLLADEPTGNLDPAIAEGVFDLLLSTARNNNLAALIVTHNMELASKMDVQYAIKEGKLFIA
jgi:lipoprotein-releasing system ATP-binding protein